MSPRLVVAVIGNDRAIHLKMKANRLLRPVVDAQLHVAAKLPLSLVGNHHSDPNRADHALAKREFLGELVAADVDALQIEARDVLGLDGCSRGTNHVTVLQRQTAHVFPGGINADLPAVVFPRLRGAAKLGLRAVQGPFLRQKVRHNHRPASIFRKQQDRVTVLGQQVGLLPCRCNNFHREERVYIGARAATPARFHAHQPGLG